MNRQEQLIHFAGIALAHIMANPHTTFVGNVPIVDPNTGLANHDTIAQLAWSMALAMDRQMPPLK